MSPWALRAGWMGALLATLGMATARAESADDRPGFKLTAGVYRYRDDTGRDLNLRWQEADTHLWLGAYQDRSFGSQWRTGVDSSWALLPWLVAQPSLQLATGGFLGGSLNVQAGDPWYVLVGWGRTNLKPLYSLNFDPNDAYTLGLGWHGEDGRAIGLEWVADDRLHTGQKQAHLTVAWPTGPQEQVSVDVLRKSGQGDAGFVRAWGWSLTYEWPAWFARLAHDPYQNFSAQDAWRWSLGVRW